MDTRAPGGRVRDSVRPDGRSNDAATAVGPGGPSPVRSDAFRVNSYTTHTQYGPSVAVAAKDGFVVTWQSHQQDGADDGIFAQRYEASGAPSGSQFQVNTYTTGWQDQSSVAFDATGGFVVAWNSAGPDGDLWGVSARCFDSSGAPRGDDFRVNAYTTSLQLGSALALSPDGNLVAVWSGSGPGDSSGVFGRHLGCGTPMAADTALFGP